MSLITILLLAIASPGWADDHAQPALLANVAGITPGAPFYVGVKFTIDSGWHIYWKNPGDSGLATDVKLNLPEGFTASELLFPVPSRIESPGPIINFGYENQTMLLIRITPPKQLAANSTINITAKATWLVCDNDNCIPGSGNLSITLPVAESASPDNQQLFDAWLAKLPVTSTDAGVTSISSAMSITNKNGSASVDLAWKKTPDDIRFIPELLKAGVLSDIAVNTEKNNTKITFNLRNVDAAEPITGLVTFASDHGSRSGFEIQIQPGLSH